MTRRVLAALLVVGLALLVTNLVAGPAPVVTTHPGPAVTVNPPAPTVDAGHGHDVGTPGMDPGQVTALVGRYAAVWAAGATIERGAWLADLAELVSPRQLAGYTHTDPAALPPPGTTVTDVTAAGVHTDGGQARVTLSTGHRLLVTVNTLPDGRLVVVNADPL